MNLQLIWTVQSGNCLQCLCATLLVGWRFELMFAASRTLLKEQAKAVACNFAGCGCVGQTALLSRLWAL